MTNPSRLADLHGPLLLALLSGDARCAEGSLGEAASRGFSLGRVARDLVAPVMSEVGEMWASGRITEAEEHLASTLVASALLRRFAAAAPSPGAPRIVFLCLPGEFHDLGLRIAAEVARGAGWEAELLGANVPRRAALTFLAQRAPWAVGLSVTLPSHLAECACLLEELRRLSPGVRILVGGQALRRDPALGRTLLGICSRGTGRDACIHDTVELEAWLRRAHPGPYPGGVDQERGLLRRRDGEVRRADAPISGGCAGRSAPAETRGEEVRLRRALRRRVAQASKGADG